jgi:predicted protein tyrosine phosphatase
VIVLPQIRSPTEAEKRVTPFFALADSILPRQGRTIAAIEPIQRGADCFEGEFLCVDLA